MSPAAVRWPDWVNRACRRFFPRLQVSYSHRLESGFGRYHFTKQGFSFVCTFCSRSPHVGQKIGGHRASFQT